MTPDWITVLMSVLVALAGVCAAILGAQAAGAILYGYEPNLKVTFIATFGSFVASLAVILMSMASL